MTHRKNRGHLHGAIESCFGMMKIVFTNSIFMCEKRCFNLIIGKGRERKINPFFMSVLYGLISPVVAYYDLEIKKIDSEKRAQIIKVVYN